MMRFFKKFVPILLSFFIVCGVIFSSYDTAKATGMEEYLYVTYWDMMNTLYAMCGYDMSVSDTQINTHGITGKQAWNNFTSFVENTAKVHWKLYSDAGKAAVKELKDLVNTATEKGISMSQDLFDMLKDVFGYQVTNSTGENLNRFDTSSASSVVKMIIAACGIQSGLYANSGVVEDVCNGYALNIVKDSGGQYSIFTNKKGYMVKDYVYSGTQKVWVNLVYVYDGKEADSGAKNALWVSSDGKCSADGAYPYSARAPVTWIIKNGAFAGADVVSAQVSAGACPKEVPDVQPWIKSPAIPDEWRIIKPGENPKKDPDEKPDFIPGIIPFKPKTPEKPEDPEKPKPDKDKDKKKKPAWNPIINPQTGNVIDPETGLDIDPETGKLIDPDTGKLIDPDDGGSGGGGGGGIADKLGKYGDITKLFPFCIPFDIVNLIKGMSAEKAPPVFHFKYYFKSINYTFKVDVDLSKYAKYIKLFRYGMQIFYILALMFMTIRISKLFS